MYPNLLHIYGDLYINSYGLAIAIGIIIFCFLIQKNQNFIKLISFEKFKNVLMLSIILGIFGGRILWLIEESQPLGIYQMISPWYPGYSFLGSLLAILIFVPYYLKNIKVPIIPFLDVMAIYVPVFHSISRIGCFLAGCCHGTMTNVAWGIIYSHPEVYVPNKLKFIKLHPTQLYSTFSLFILFILMYMIFQKIYKKNGQLSCLYLIFASVERFFNDFYRADRILYNFLNIQFLSIHQWISLLIFFISTIIFLNITFEFITFKKYTSKNNESF